MDLTHPANNAGSPGGYWVGMGGFCGTSDVTVEPAQSVLEGDGVGRGDGITFGTQTPTPFTSFSPQTCLQLLPTLSSEQTEFETNYFRSLLGPKFNVKPDTRKSPVNIARNLSCELSSDIPHIVNNFALCEKLNNNFFILLERAQNLLDDMRSQRTSDTVSDKCSDQVTQLLSDSEPVRFLDTKINSTVDYCTEGVNFSVISDREVDYFGNLPYQYGRIRHEPKPYPETPFFKETFDKLRREIPNFSRDTYTCLVTRYKDGDSTIPSHSDNEVCIVPGSTIYTVSVGAQRTLVCKNIVGSERQYILPDGSVFAMSQSSQLTWEHSVPRELCDDTRISFTFRRIVPKRTIPPISEPQPVNSKKRVLFLTDSLHMSFPTHLLNTSEMTCVKKIEFQLSNIGNYENEFRQFDYVVISTGINDITRYNHTGHDLAAVMYNKLKLICVNSPNTVFIFNSLLLTQTGYHNINNSVNFFNRAMFDLSLDIYDLGNFLFLDSHSLLFGVKTIKEWGNGIHITPTAAKIISQSIVKSVTELAMERPVAQYWPLRPQFKELVCQFHSVPL